MSTVAFDLGSAILDLIMESYPDIARGDKESLAQAGYQIGMCLGGVAATCAGVHGHRSAVELLDTVRRYAEKNMLEISAAAADIPPGQTH